MSRLGTVVWGCAACLVSAQGWTVTPLLAVELARECASGYSSEDVPERCAIYIAGFLDGAVATDARVAENVVREIEQRSSAFKERAVRTRLGEQMKKFGSSVYAEYCVGDPVPVQELISAMRSEFAQKPPGPEDLARDAVYGVLRANYPCRE